MVAMLKNNQLLHQATKSSKRSSTARSEKRKKKCAAGVVG
jgi:hypothetical protein